MGSRKDPRSNPRVASMLVVAAAFVSLLGADGGCKDKAPQMATQLPCKTVPCEPHDAPRVVEVRIEAVANRPDEIDVVPNEIHACLRDTVFFRNKTSEPVVIAFAPSSCPFDVCTLTLGGFAEDPMEVTRGAGACYRYESRRQADGMGTFRPDSTGARALPVVVVDS